MPSLLSSGRSRRVASQAVFLAVIGLAAVASVFVARDNIQAQGIATGFDFLQRTTGWPVSFSVIEVGPRSTYARVLVAGLLNTVLVGFLALIFSTILGTALALMRVSGNYLAQMLGTLYIEVFRNVPIILQVFFWYAVLTHLPGPRQALSLGGAAFLSNRGLMLPTPSMPGSDWLILAVAAVLITLSMRVLRRWHSLGICLSLGLLLFAVLFAALLLTGRPADAPLLSIPELRGLRFVGGAHLKPEFTALLVGLVLFGAAYIGEIVRGGLLAVGRGRLEAGLALGLTGFQVNRFIRIPLAFRAMLPALTNQYIWLMKATTVGIAIGFPDYFAIVSTSINQAGNTLELIGLLMLGFWVVNNAMALALNRLNDRLRLKGNN